MAPRHENRTNPCTNHAVSITDNRMEPTNASTPILDLPIEILDRIIGFVDTDTPQHVRNLRQTCRTISELCEPAFCNGLSSLSKFEKDCPPDSCKNYSSLRRSSEFILAARPERYNLVNTFIAHTKADRNDRGQRGLVRFVHKLPKLRVLHVCDVRCCRDHKGFGEDPKVSFYPRVNNMLSSLAFTELRECRLCPLSYSPVQIAPVLKAPKLTTLVVSYPTLDSLDETLPAINSIPLKHLTLLVNPRMNRQAVHSILSMPKALETLAFDDSRAPSVQSEDGMLEELLLTLARYQPGLKALKVFATARSVLSDPSLTGRFDFSQLTGLKELSFSNHRTIPINCFFNLPTGLESLRLNNNVNTIMLAKALIQLSSRPNFTCPLHLDIDVDYSLREHSDEFSYYLRDPDSIVGRTVLTGRLRGIDMLMRNLFCKQLTLTERGYTAERRLEAIRTYPARGIKMERPYVLLEDTYYDSEIYGDPRPYIMKGRKGNDHSVFDGCSFPLRRCSPYMGSRWDSDSHSD
ncbi:hypothetical protein AYL99_11659 [Fonsecaea erecta]|uniref:F-box domain-containing protein n=1 Tax=Fonsecaea erecta TaxID=1367422 RepID=A0A178Z349_9EURO|nr:hypothetical protein AYL99_11659 [Fonsecaea erecta]OAP54124.1 hypothetical protein AYL99_11659 [Fonsecaea erecta]